MKFSHRVKISIISVFQYYSTLRHVVKYMESTKHCVSLLLPILEKLSKFSQNHKFLEVLSKKGHFFFQRRVQNFKLAGAKSLQGASRFRGHLPAPLWKKASPVYKTFQMVF